MKRYNRNILVFAENNGNESGFNIYLEFSGQREYLVTHRHNGAMFSMLKNGIRLDDMQRGVQEMNIPSLCGRRSGIVPTKQLRNSMRYLMVVIDDFITDREECA